VPQLFATKIWIFVIDKYIALTNGRYRKGFNEFAKLWSIVVDTSPETNMADVHERKKIAREIEKTSESIRKKHRALKTSRINEDIALNTHFKSLIEPLRLR